MPAGDPTRTRTGRTRPTGVPRSTARRAEGRARGAGAASAGEMIRGGRAHRVAVATSGILGVSSTRRAAVLALVVCALALTVAVPLRNFLSQRQELAALQAQHTQLSRRVDELTHRRDELRDPRHVQAEARERLGYVRAGEIPYVVQLPGDTGAPTGGDRRSAQPAWFQRLWSDLRGVSK